VNAFTGSLAEEVARFGIRVRAVVPGQSATTAWQYGARRRIPIARASYRRRGRVGLGRAWLSPRDLAPRQLRGA